MPLMRVAMLLLAVGASACGGGGDSPASPSQPAAGGCVPVAGTPSLASQLVVSGLTRPLDLQVPPGDRERLFLVEQGGRVRIVRAGAGVGVGVIVATPFLDLAGRVATGDEQGLLGLAFHPQYASNGRFFVNYTDRAGDTHITEFRVSSNPDLADPASERDLIFVRQPFANHNGGGLAFGPDGMLYAGLGDGGSGGDPMGNGQSLGTLLGKLLRIDVDRGAPYAVPTDNPFARTAGARGEIWSYGLRNPWRFAFDRLTGDLIIGDVGQNQVEEIDLALGGRGGDNFGWNVMEGSLCFRPASGCSTAGLTLPIAEYRHTDGNCSVTGGVVYRGCRMPGWHGTYFYADYCSRVVRSFRVDAGRAADQRDWTATIGRGLNNPTAFGVDADGEVYITDRDGELYRIVPAS